MNVAILSLLLGIVAPTGATTQASNGVAVEIKGDDFDTGKTYFTQPIKAGESYWIVGATRKGSDAVKVFVLYNIYYVDEWRRYSHASFRGGEAAEVTSLKREVVSCASISRYSQHCDLQEAIDIELTDQQITKYAEGDTIPLKVSADSGQSAMIYIPIAHIRAVREVASKPH